MSHHLRLVDTTPDETSPREHHGAGDRDRPERARAFRAPEAAPGRLNWPQGAVVLPFARASAEEARRRHPSRLARALD